MTTLPVGEMAALGTALLWTLSALAWTAAGRSIGALAVCVVRLGITVVFLMAYGQIGRGLWWPSDASRETWTILGVSGLFGFFLADLCLFKAFLLIGPRLSLLVLSLSPPMTAIASWLWLHDKLAWHQWGAMGVTLAGVVWVVLEEPHEKGPFPVSQHGGLGFVLAVLAAAGQAIGLVLSKQGIGDYDAGAATFIRVLAALAAFAILLTAIGRWPVVLAATHNARAMLILTLGAIVGPFVGVILCMIALRHCHAGVAATIISTMPVLILPFSIVLHRERVSLRALGGAIVSVLGVALLMLTGPCGGR